VSLPRLTRLSPKALRLYDELGLLSPARVDSDSGYRWYEAAQVEQARLVALLRQVGVPLAQIKALLALEPTDAARQLAELWPQVEADHAVRRELVGYLVDRLNGKRSVMYEVATRKLPARSLLCLLRHVEGQEAAFAFGKEFIALFRERSVEGIGWSAFQIYYGEVSEDSDGPIE
jgi:DNA-binding transcriptional MerR regulator